MRNNSIPEFTYCPKSSRLNSEFVKLVVQLHQDGWSNVEIGEKVGRHNSNIARLLKKYASNIVYKNNDIIASQTTMPTPKQPKSRRIPGVTAPETTESTNSLAEETIEQKVLRLEKELKNTRAELQDATLMRDFYDEMINVAESQFNISIRKKAGTKR